jgi:hypothetical protein
MMHKKKWGREWQWMKNPKNFIRIGRTLLGWKACHTYCKGTVAQGSKLLFLTSIDSIWASNSYSLKYFEFLFESAEIYEFESCSPGSEPAWTKQKCEAMGLLLITRGVLNSVEKNSSGCQVRPRGTKLLRVTDPADQNSAGYQIS